jgi:hypothetical protein
MKLSTAIAVLSATVTLAVPASDVTLDKRATTGVYLCNDRDWQGYCVHINSPPSECVPLAGDLNDLVSSAGPDQGSFCYFFVYVSQSLITTCYLMSCIAILVAVPPPTSSTLGIRAWRICRRRRLMGRRGRRGTLKIS